MEEEEELDAHHTTAGQASLGARCRYLPELTQSPRQTLETYLCPYLSPCCLRSSTTFWQPGRSLRPPYYTLPPEAQPFPIPFTASHLLRSLMEERRRAAPS